MWDGEQTTYDNVWSQLGGGGGDSFKSFLEVYFLLSLFFACLFLSEKIPCTLIIPHTLHTLYMKFGTGFQVINKLKNIYIYMYNHFFFCSKEVLACNWRCFTKCGIWPKGICALNGQPVEPHHQWYVCLPLLTWWAAFCLQP